VLLGNGATPKEVWRTQRMKNDFSPNSIRKSTAASWGGLVFSQESWHSCRRPNGAFAPAILRVRLCLQMASGKHSEPAKESDTQRTRASPWFPGTIVMKSMKGPHSCTLVQLCANLVEDLVRCCWNLGFPEVGSPLRMSKAYFHYCFLELSPVTYFATVTELQPCISSIALHEGSHHG
jgi:hypothetical protein